jgi:hypothetical protein
MARFQIITLVDITQTNPNRSETDPHRLAQQANFNSLIQAIGLRANVVWISSPRERTGALPRDLDGKAAHWTWTFDVERDDVFLKDGNSVALLIDDLNGVPIIPDLNSSVELDPACFISKGDNANIWVFELSQDE